MSRKFVQDFDQAIKGTAPGSTGIAILNVLTAVGCLVAAHLLLVEAFMDYWPSLSTLL